MNTTTCNCPHCNQAFTIPPDLAGQTVQCSVCQQTFTAPAPHSPPPLPARKTFALTPANLTTPKESTYLAFVVLFSVLLWAAAVLSIFLAVIGLIMAVAIWFANGLLVAHLKSESVKVDPTQLPGLAATFQDVCGQLGVNPVPDLYVLQSGGMLNAFTSKHAGRNFVVVYSELLEAYGPESPEIRFLLGHELGHIRRRHVLKQILLAPGLLMPLIGNAYRRACETTCDRYGAFASGDTRGALDAMMILAGGKQARQLMNPVAFAGQHRQLRGFFVSWHELISGYPTLSQRVHNLVELSEGREPKRASRHPLSYVFALFSFSGHGGGGANLMITIAIIGLLAAIAIPSFVKAREQAQTNACINNLRQLEAAKEQWALTRNAPVVATPTPADIRPFLRSPSQAMTCPAGGTISLNPAGTPATCTKPRHCLPE